MKVIVAFVFLAVSGVLSQSAVTYSASIGPNQAPAYGYAYNINDPTTGDIKEHHEARNGDAVSGSYSLVEADGSRRVVDYTADDAHGFNANVRHEGHGVVPVVAPKIAAPAIPAPAVAYSAPASYAAYPYAAYPYSAYPYASYPYAYHGSAYAYPYAASGYAYPYAKSHYAYPYAAYPYTPYSYSYPAASTYAAHPYVSTTSYAY